VVEDDLVAFGAALTELQMLVGECFSSAQAGVYATAASEALVEHLRAEGLDGVGQSSWGPALYGFCCRSADERAALLSRLRSRFGLAPEAAFWTQASRGGAVVQAIPALGF
jgi:predicted sugar kinase